MLCELNALLGDSFKYSEFGLFLITDAFIFFDPVRPLILLFLPAGYPLLNALLLHNFIQNVTKTQILLRNAVHQGLSHQTLSVSFAE
jgi:hypothetical protein